MIDNFFIKITELFLLIINLFLDILNYFYNIITYFFKKFIKKDIKSKEIDEVPDNKEDYENFNDSKSNISSSNNNDNKGIFIKEGLFGDFKDYLKNNFKNNSYNQDSFKNEDLNNDYLFENLTYRFSIKPNKILSSKFNNAQNLKKAVFLLMGLFLILSIFLSIGMALIVILIIIMAIYLIIKLPDIQRKNLYSSISRELPFALRHMACELKAGKGLNDALMSIVKADYGALSFEYNRVINEVQYGISLEDALSDMSNRVGSNGLRRVNQQIISTQNLGSNLSQTLFIIAEDISFDMRIKLKSYAQKLNGFIMIYTFLVVLAPVILLIMIIAASTVLGVIIPPGALYIIYGLFFPMIILFMALIIKRLEPKI